MIGALHPAASNRFLISGTAPAASGTFTVQRTISEPASASSIVCLKVDSISAVSVFVMDCTTIGAPPPTRTCPTFTPYVFRRGCFEAAASNPSICVNISFNSNVDSPSHEIPQFHFVPHHSSNREPRAVFDFAVVARVFRPASFSYHVCDPRNRKCCTHWFCGWVFDSIASLPTVQERNTTIPRPDAFQAARGPPRSLTRNFSIIYNHHAKAAYL